MKHLARSFLTILICVIIVPVTVHGIWPKETVDTASVGMGCSMQLDSNEYPHVVYSFGSSWKYAYMDGSGWHYETPDTDGTSPQIVLDDSDNAHICYAAWVGMSSEIRYAHNDTGIFVVDTLDTDSFLGEPRIDIDDSGYLHVVYMKPGVSDTTIQHMYQDFSGWNSDPTISEAYIESYIAFDLDVNNYAHFIYVATMGTHTMTHAYEDSMGWHTEGVDGKNCTMNYNLITDGAGQPHVVYNNEDNGEFGYSFKTGSLWTSEVIDLGGGMYSDICMDGSGNTHVSYSEGFTVGLKYARRDGGAWNLDVAEADTAGGWNNTIDVDNAIIPHICFFNSSDSSLVYTFSYTLLVPSLSIFGIILLLGSCSVLLFRKRSG